MNPYLLVAVGGALGSMARYGGGVTMRWLVTGAHGQLGCETGKCRMRSTLIRLLEKRIGEGPPDAADLKGSFTAF